MFALQGHANALATAQPYHLHEALKSFVPLKHQAVFSPAAALTHTPHTHTHTRSLACERACGAHSPASLLL